METAERRALQWFDHVMKMGEGNGAHGEEEKDQDWNRGSTMMRNWLPQKGDNDHVRSKTSRPRQKRDVGTSTLDSSMG